MSLNVQKKFPAPNIPHALHALKIGIGANQHEHVFPQQVLTATGLSNILAAAQWIYQCTLTAQHAQELITGARLTHLA